MKKQVYISADYDDDNGDRNVVDKLNDWGDDDKHKIDFIDMAKVVSGSVSDDSDCRACDLKKEFNDQIKKSSSIIIVVGDKTASRTAGSVCPRVNHNWFESYCTPYKHNTSGTKVCKALNTIDAGDDIGNINNYSYLRHEFEEAKARGKHITVVYNSLYKESFWLPSYLKDYEDVAQPFWIKNSVDQKVGNYDFIKRELGYD